MITCISLCTICHAPGGMARIFNAGNADDNSDMEESTAAPKVTTGALTSCQMSHSTSVADAIGGSECCELAGGWLRYDASYQARSWIGNSWFPCMLVWLMMLGRDVTVLSESFCCSVLDNPAGDSLPLLYYGCSSRHVAIYPGNTHHKMTANVASSKSIDSATST